MPQLNNVEDVIKLAIQSQWNVYGHGAGQWNEVTRMIDSQEDVLFGLFHNMITCESQLVKEVKEDLNFLYWIASAHVTMQIEAS